MIMLKSLYNSTGASAASTAGDGGEDSGTESRASGTSREHARNTQH